MHQSVNEYVFVPSSAADTAISPQGEVIFGPSKPWIHPFASVICDGFIEHLFVDINR